MVTIVVVVMAAVVIIHIYQPTCLQAKLTCSEAPYIFSSALQTLHIKVSERRAFGKWILSVMEIARAIPKQWKSQHPLTSLRVHQMRLSLHEIRALWLGRYCRWGSGGAIAKDAAVRPQVWIIWHLSFSKDSTGNINMERFSLRLIIIMQTMIFGFEAFRLGKFCFCPIWKEKTLQTNIYLGWTLWSSN